MATVKSALNGKATELTNATKHAGETRGLVFERYFTDGRISPFDAVEWEKRTAQIGNEKGVTIFKQENVEVPKGWSQTATNIVASKYFHGKPGTSEREGSARQLIGRVVSPICLRCCRIPHRIGCGTSKHIQSFRLSPGSAGLIFFSPKSESEPRSWFPAGCFPPHQPCLCSARYCWHPVRPPLRERPTRRMTPTIRTRT